MATSTYGSLAAEAAAFLENSANAVGGFNGIQPEIRRQGAYLVRWAEGRGLLKIDPCVGLEKYRRDTTEHFVYFGSANNRVIKCTKPGRFGWGHGVNARHCAATPLFYLQRLDLMNEVFGSDLRLEGIALGLSEYEPQAGLMPYIVTSQRYIEIADANKPHPSEEEIQHFMESMHFQLMTDCYYNWFRDSDGITIIVTDTRILNFIISHAGIVPIDLVVSRK